MSAHRYWRISVASTDNGSTIAASEIQMRGTVGGSSLCVGGTASASSATSGAAANAVDGNTSTYWQTGSVGGVGWWQYDFGAGNAVDLAEVYIMPRTSWPSYAPNEWSLQYSDNGSDWTTSVTWKQRTAWTSGVARTFAAYFPAAVPGGHRCWRINVTALTSGTQAVLAEVELRATPGGANQCGSAASGLPGADSSSLLSTYGAERAVDASTSTRWQSSSSAALPHWWQYDFGTDQVVTQIAVTPYATTTAPTTFALQASDDGASWSTHATFTATWPDTSQQTFTVPSSNRPQVSCIT